jgi:large subunit ribosomal protein L29
MKYSEINQKTSLELRKDLAHMRDELATYRVKLRLSQTKKVKEYQVLRKDIARIMTALAAKSPAI